jgi:hypothetical protein
VYACCLGSGIAFAQTGSSTPAAARAGITLLAEPFGVRLQYRGGLAMDGRSPLELPAEATGRFSLVAEGEGISRTQGVFRVSTVGHAPEVLSEPPGMSAGLFVRSLNFPGFPSYTAKRENRGAVLILGGVGALFGAGRSHLRYRDRLDEFGDYAADRALDERRSRDNWVRFGAATWGVSALDYMIRPRFDVREASPGRLALIAPTTGRGGALWRSLLVPGAGQEFAGHRSRGTLWLGAVLAAGAGVVIANGSVDQAQTKVDWTTTLIDSAGPSERVVLQRELEVRKNDLQEAVDARRGTGIALVAIWIANVLDAAIMTVAEPAAVPPRVEASSPFGPNGPGVTLRYRF